MNSDVKIFNPRLQNTFCLFETTADEISEVINQLNTKKKTVLKKHIPTKFIKIANNNIISPSCMISLIVVFNSVFIQANTKLLKFYPFIKKCSKLYSPIIDQSAPRFNLIKNMKC